LGSWPVVVVGAVVLAGCAARGGVVRVSGEAAPLTRAAGPSASAAPADGYRTEAVTWAGATARVPVPVGWSRVNKAGGIADFRDPTGRVLLRVQVSRRTGSSLEDAAAALDRSLAGSVRDYRRIGITAADWPLGPAVDLAFTFSQDGVPRQVVDRLGASGDAGVAVYYSAPVADFARQKAVWEHAVAGVAAGRAGG
jgi:hypothetical protein